MQHGSNRFFAKMLTLGNLCQGYSDETIKIFKKELADFDWWKHSRERALREGSGTLLLKYRLFKFWCAGCIQL